MNKKILYISLLVASAGFIVGCASKNLQTKNITVTPQNCKIIPNDGYNADLDVVFHVPSDYLKKRSRLVIMPQLIVADSIRSEFDPIVVDAPIYKKKMERRQVLENYTDTLAHGLRSVEDTSASFDLPYSVDVVLPEGVDNASVVAYVSTDGCGECTGFDTVEVASISRPSLFISGLNRSLKCALKSLTEKGKRVWLLKLTNMTSIWN